LAGPAHAAVLARVGDASLDEGGVAEVQAVLVATGAVAEVERAIEARVETALAALAEMPITEPARTALGDLARFVAWRDR
jgi:geranylgeranyl diphosphate synthase, type I